MGKLYTQEFYFLPSHKCNLPPWSLLMHLPSIVKPLKFDFCLYFKEAYVSYFQWFCFFFFQGMGHKGDGRAAQNEDKVYVSSWWRAVCLTHLPQTSRKQEWKEGRPASLLINPFPDSLKFSLHLPTAQKPSLSPAPMSLRPCTNPLPHLLWLCPSPPFPSDAKTAHQFLPNVW